MSGSHRALLTRWQMVYYSCPGFLEKTSQKFISARFSGPRGIRTPDLLNAIETRSQLRYGPGLNVFRAALRAPSPPEGGCVRYGPVITVVA